MRPPDTDASIQFLVRLNDPFKNIFHFRVSFNVSSVRTQKRTTNWKIDGGYESSIKDQNSYPFRVIDAGLQYSLYVILKINSYDVDYLCGGYTQGFQISFHSPNDIPRMKKDFYELSPKQGVFYLIEPKLMKTDPKVRNFNPQVRQCYHSSERKLRFYREYTRNNCLSECLSNFTLVQCGCVHFSMLRM